jgi:uncharacterized protein YkwD
MGRAFLRALTLTLTGAALAVAGCGGSPSTDPAGPRASAFPAGTVELTDGRLGGAIELRAGDRLRELAPGGPLDVRERDMGPNDREGVGAADVCPDPALVPAPATLPAITETTLCLLNGERTDRGLAPLAVNARLTAAATAYAGDLVAGTYFSHTGRDGSSVRDRIQRTGYLPGDADWLIGENLAWGTGGLATPGSIMQAWMNSPGHRENILNPEFREIGIGIATGNPAKADGAGATYATSFGAIQGANHTAELASAAGPATRAGTKAAKAAKAKAKARKARKRIRRAAKAQQARNAQSATARASRPGKSKPRTRKGRGPKARIAI